MMQHEVYSAKNLSVAQKEMVDFLFKEFDGRGLKTVIAADRNNTKAILGLFYQMIIIRYKVRMQIGLRTFSCFMAKFSAYTLKQLK